MVDFAPTLEKVHSRVVKKETIINSFKTTGTWPLNQESVHYERCLGANKPKPIEESLIERMNESLNESLNKSLNECLNVRVNVSLN